jgi:hypothetical protein
MRDGEVRRHILMPKRCRDRAFFDLPLLIASQAAFGPMASISARASAAAVY